MEVPKATIVRPIVNSLMPNCFAKRAELSTSQSAPFTSSSRPKPNNATLKTRASIKANTFNRKRPKWNKRVLDCRKQGLNLKPAPFQGAARMQEGGFKAKLRMGPRPPQTLNKDSTNPYAGGRIRTPEATKAPAPQAGRIDRYLTPAWKNW